MEHRSRINNQQRPFTLLLLSFSQDNQSSPQLFASSFISSPSLWSWKRIKRPHWPHAALNRSLHSGLLWLLSTSDTTRWCWIFRFAPLKRPARPLLTIEVSNKVLQSHTLKKNTSCTLSNTMIRTYSKNWTVFLISNHHKR